MSLLFAITLIIAGFFLLIKSADWLVDGATAIARKYGISDLVIGLTIVSFGTSTPELLVNIFASFKGSTEIAIGNIVGSNISNTLLILGVTSVITPLAVKKSTVFKEIPFSILAAFTLFVAANDRLIDGYGSSMISRGDGLMFLSFFVIFMYYTFGVNQNANERRTKPKIKPLAATGMMISGIIGLGIGGEITVRGAIEVAGRIGMSESFIGLTIVALGTSLPELVASVVAARKGVADIAIGNIVGSNIFNIFWILGLSSLIKPLPFDRSVNADLLLVVVSAIALFFFVHNGKIHKRIMWWKQDGGHTLQRWEGMLMLMTYVAYVMFIAVRG